MLFRYIIIRKYHPKKLEMQLDEKNKSIYTEKHEGSDLQISTIKKRITRGKPATISRHDDNEVNVKLSSCMRQRCEANLKLSSQNSANRTSCTLMLQNTLI